MFFNWFIFPSKYFIGVGFKLIEKSTLSMFSGSPFFNWLKIWFENSLLVIFFWVPNSTPLSLDDLLFCNYFAISSIIILALSLYPSIFFYAIDFKLLMMLYFLYFEWEIKTVMEGSNLFSEIFGTYPKNSDIRSLISFPRGSMIKFSEITNKNWILLALEKAF